MIETSTSVNKLNYEPSKQQEMPVEDLGTQDIVFYENIKAQLDSLNRNPSEETISKILAYSRKK
ncbi:MAG TPA: hypothetical protein VKB19_03665 [Pedobacter sp.]|nr:hypothetical protein [Pedobacter sp.]